MKEDTPKNPIKLWATGLLLLSAVIFVLSNLYLHSHPVWPWLAAFSEAAMVGALADWFAVTALFRHPLGLPIPHTAIIPKSQTRIAKTLSRFVQDNFLNPESLAPKLASAKLGQRFVSWLSEPESARTVAIQLKDLLRGILNSMDDKQVSSFIAKALPDLSKQIKLAPLAAEVIDSVRSADSNGKLFDEILSFSEKLMLKHNILVEGLISKELPWYLPGFVKHHLYAQVTEAIRRTISAMQADKSHSLRLQLTQLVDHASAELKQNEIWETRLQEAVGTFCQSTTVVEYLATFKSAIIERLNNDQENLISDSLVTAISFSAELINKDPDISEKLNQFLAQIMLRVVKDYGGHAGSFIEDTMRGWDSKLLSDKIEAEVGKDLQFIRINGTLVGGLVGLLIHAVLILIEK